MPALRDLSYLSQVNIIKYANAQSRKSTELQLYSWGLTRYKLYYTKKMLLTLL